MKTIRKRKNVLRSKLLPLSLRNKSHRAVTDVQPPSNSAGRQRTHHAEYPFYPVPAYPTSENQ